MSVCSRCGWASHYELRDDICNRCRAKELTRSTTTRRCGHCGEQRPIEVAGHYDLTGEHVAGNPDTYLCPRCGARSAWLCWRCGARVGGGILEVNDERICAHCHQRDLEGVTRPDEVVRVRTQ